jgi:hypothetical protein
LTLFLLSEILNQMSGFPLVGPPPLRLPPLKGRWMAVG